VKEIEIHRFGDHVSKRYDSKQMALWEDVAAVLEIILVGLDSVRLTDSFRGCAVWSIEIGLLKMIGITDRFEHTSVHFLYLCMIYS